MSRKRKRKNRYKHAQNNEGNTLDAFSVGLSNLQEHDAPHNQDKPNHGGKELGPSMGFVKIWWNELGDSKNSNRIVAVFTIIIAITGIGYAVFAGLQWSAIDGQLAQMQMASRPWVFTIPNFSFNPIPTTESLREIPVTVQIENLGVSPAIHAINTLPIVGLNTDSDIIEHLKSCSFTYPEDETGAFLPSSQSSLRVNGITTRTVTRTLSEDERKDVTHHVKQLLIMGAIKYGGVRGGDFETKYCYIWNSDSLNGHTLPFGECRCSEKK